MPKRAADAAADGPAPKATAQQKSLDNHLRFAQSPKCTNVQAKTQAQYLQTEYNKCTDPRAAQEFAQKFFEAKKSKPSDFSWAKDFQETWQATTESSCGLKEKYYTLPRP